MQVKSALNYKPVIKSNINFKANTEIKKKNNFDEVNNIQKVGASVASLALPIQMLSLIWKGVLKHKLRHSNGIPVKKLNLLKKRMDAVEKELLYPATVIGFIGFCISCYPSFLKLFRKPVTTESLFKDSVVDKPQKYQK